MSTRRGDCAQSGRRKREKGHKRGLDLFFFGSQLASRGRKFRTTWTVSPRMVGLQPQTLVRPTGASDEAGPEKKE